MALSRTYGIKGILAEGPTLKKMTIEGGIVKLTFDHAPMGLSGYGKEIKSFIQLRP